MVLTCCLLYLTLMATAVTAASREFMSSGYAFSASLWFLAVAWLIKKRRSKILLGALALAFAILSVSLFGYELYKDVGYEARMAVSLPIWPVYATGTISLLFSLASLSYLVHKFISNRVAEDI